jgi:hypothetical protein
VPPPRVHCRSAAAFRGPYTQVSVAGLVNPFGFDAVQWKIWAVTGWKISSVISVSVRAGFTPVQFGFGQPATAPLTVGEAVRVAGSRLLGWPCPPDHLLSGRDPRSGAHSARHGHRSPKKLLPAVVCSAARAEAAVGVSRAGSAPGPARLGGAERRLNPWRWTLKRSEPQRRQAGTLHEPRPAVQLS